MGGATFEYPCQSCMQETDSPTHGDRNQGTPKTFRGNEFVGMTGGKNAEQAAKHFGAWKGASPVYEFTKCKQPNLRPNPR